MARKLPRYGMAAAKRPKPIRRPKPKAMRKPKPLRAQPMHRPVRAKAAQPKRNLPVARAKRPLKPKGRIVKQQRQRVKAAQKRYQSYRRRALRSSGRPQRPYEQARYDPGMQPTTLDDYIRDNQLDNAIWHLTREDPYYDAPYMEDDDLAAQAGDYSQMWTEPYYGMADAERENYYGRFGEWQPGSSRSSPAKPTTNPYDRTISELIEGGPGLAGDAFGDLMTDRRYRAEGRSKRNETFAEWWADMIGGFQDIEFKKTGGRQDFMGDMIREATRDVQHREKLGQSQREFRAKLSSDEREAMAKLRQDIRYETQRLKQYGARNRALNRQGAARVKQGQQRVNQAAARLGISAKYLKQAQRNANKTVDVYQSRVRGYLVNKYGEPILDAKGRRIKVPKKARVGAKGGDGGGANPLDNLPKP